MQYERYIEANIVMRSIAPFAGKPEVFTIGGFGATASNSSRFSFDWCTYSANIEHDENNRLIMNIELDDFDIEFFEDCQADQGNQESNNISFSEINAKFLAESTLNEVFYECYIVDTDRDNDWIRMELVSFVITMSNGYGEDTQVILQTEIDRYNKEEGFELNFSMFDNLFLSRRKVLDEIVTMLIVERDLSIQTYLIRKIMENNFDDTEKELFKRYEMTTFLSYLLYYCRKNISKDMSANYALIDEYIDLSYKRQQVLDKLS